MGLELTTLRLLGRVLFLLSYQGSSAGRALSLQHNTTQPPIHCAMAQIAQKKPHLICVMISGILIMDTFTAVITHMLSFLMYCACVQVDESFPVISYISIKIYVVMKPVYCDRLYFSVK